MAGTAERDGTRRGRGDRRTPGGPGINGQIHSGAPGMTIDNAGREIPESVLVSPVAPGALAAADVAIAVQLACLLEVSAPKPGNVSPGRSFADARYEDFLASAAAIGAPIGGAAT